MRRSTGFQRTGMVAVATAFPILVFIAIPSARAAGPGAVVQPVEIGTTVVITRRVTGTFDGKTRRLRRGFRVFHKEELETRARSRLELMLDDETKLALGPNARLRLDDFATGKAEEGKSKITLSFLRGAFRFITGKSNSKSYQIETPTATIGVSGTVFDVFIGTRGDALVLLHEGEVEICTRARRCRRHNTVGRIVHAAITGVITEPLKWTAALIPGIGVRSAFPFVGRRLKIDPIRRLRHAAIIDKAVVAPVKGAGRALRQGGKAIDRGTRGIGRALRKISPFQ